MKRMNQGQWLAAAGYASVAVSGAGMLCERGAPPINAGPEAFIAYVGRYRSELLTQSLLLILGACALLAFFSSLRSYLGRAEGGARTLSSLAFASSCAWAILQMTFQGFQIAMVLTVDTDPAGSASLSVLAYALSVVAYAPLALTLAAAALLSLSRKALPAWLGILSGLGSAANLLMLFGIVAKEGILTPGGALTYALYALLPMWLIGTTASMIRGLETASAEDPPCRA
jgi:hypothetical protein